MKRKIYNRILGLLLAGLLFFNNVDFTIFATETETVSESMSIEQNPTQSVETDESQNDVQSTIEEMESEESESKEKTVVEEIRSEENRNEEKITVDGTEETTIFGSETVITNETESEVKNTDEEYSTEESDILESTVSEEVTETEDNTVISTSSEMKTEESDEIEEIIDNLSDQEVEGDFTYTVSDTEATIVKYTGSATELVIPSTLGGYTVTSILSLSSDTIKKVTIPNTIKYCGNFYNGGALRGAMQ